MAKSATEVSNASSSTRSGPPPLSPSVRRQLGSSLRNFYADTLSEPVSERLEALLARLDRPKA